MPLPSDVRSGLYRSKQQERAAMAAQLTPRAARAFEAWSLVKSQVTTLNPGAARAEDVRVKLDTDAALAGLDLAGVEPADRAWSWRSVLMLHDIALHEGGGPQDVCSRHGVVNATEYEPECDACRMTFGAPDVR